MSETKLLEKDTFGVVEVLGHNTFAGKVSEHVIGGTAFIRVDVPELPEERTPYGNHEHIRPAIPAYTKLIGAGSIYAITPCTEEIARKVAADKHAAPVTVLDFSTTTRRIEGSSQVHVDQYENVSSDEEIDEDRMPF